MASCRSPAAQNPTSRHGAQHERRHHLQAGQAVRASDSERDQVVALLQGHFADGRLTQAELEERAGAALTARTRDQLRALTADLPDSEMRAAWPARPAVVLDSWLLCLLLCIHPPAGLVDWLLCRRSTTRD